jgi:hypothetical protein
MKNIKYILFVIAAFAFLLPLKSNAQKNNEVFLSYNFGVPIGDTKDYVSKVSLVGAELSWKRLEGQNVSISLSVGWNVFFEETSEILNLKNADVSGKQNRYINAFPMLIGAQYYIGKNKSRPYVGLNTGFLYSVRKLQLGIYEETDNNWRFMLQPEAGFIINYDNSSDIAIGVSYNYSKSATFDASGKSVAESWVGLKIAYGWRPGF